MTLSALSLGDELSVTPYVLNRGLPTIMGFVPMEGQSLFGQMSPSKEIHQENTLPGGYIGNGEQETHPAALCSAFSVHSYVVCRPSVPLRMAALAS